MRKFIFYLVFILLAISIRCDDDYATSYIKAFKANPKLVVDSHIPKIHVNNNLFSRVKAYDKNSEFEMLNKFIRD